MEAEAEAPGPGKKKKVKPGSFQGLGLGQATYKAIMRMGYKMPTPIQRKTIPTILEGQDVVAMARTGSGKTAAFLIPICERLGSHSVSVGVRAVVLSPTRELAMQTAKFCRQLSRFSGLRCCLLVGGQAMEKQFDHLANNPDVIIATPGRLMHHILEAELSLSRVQILVFDEADRLFELGFAEQLQKILDATPISRQCLLFSATLPSQLVSFSRAGVKDPVFIRLDVETTLSESLDLWFLYVRKDEKLAAAVSVLRRMHKDNKSTIMFVATRHHVEFFGELLSALDLTVAVVYGSMDQVARQEQVARFRHKKARILVTTDVAARGIDIPQLDHVLNFDFPPSAKLFVHRSGRTARAGRSGLSASLVTIDDLPYTVELMLFLGHKLAVPGTTSEGGNKAVIGAVPHLAHEVESINALLADEGSILQTLHKSMMSSYHLYNKTRPSASKQSVARAKGLLEECGGPAQLQMLFHPAFEEDVAKLPGHAPSTLTAAVERSFVKELRGFRPRAEKIGNVISSNAIRTMALAKMDASAVAAARNTAAEAQAESILDKPDPAAAEAPQKGPAQNKARGKKRVREAAPKPVIKDRPRVSKRARKRLQEDGGASAGKEDFPEWDVKVDGVDLGAAGGSKSKPSKGPATEEFYLSTEIDRKSEAKERGLEMERYQMDLMPDDSGDIRRAKSVIRWDAKKKKYLPVMVSVDGRVVKKGSRNESGQKVKGDGEKSKIYQKWAKASKRRIQKVGELEHGIVDHLGKLQASKGKTVDFADWAPDAGDGGEQGESTRKRKPIVAFHGEIEDKYLTHKQRRLKARREQKEYVGILHGPSKKELKTPDQMRKDLKHKERMKLKQQPQKRKQRAKEAKEARMKRVEERQMSYGARTKSKMLIIEGPKKWKRKGGRSRERFF